MNDLNGLAFDAACDCHDRGRLRTVAVIERLHREHAELLVRLDAFPAEIEHAARNACAEVEALEEAAKLEFGPFDEDEEESTPQDRF